MKGLHHFAPLIHYIVHGENVFEILRCYPSISRAEFVFRYILHAEILQREFISNAGLEARLAGQQHLAALFQIFGNFTGNIVR